MAEIFGDLERSLADLYPYRWPISFGLLLVATAAAAYGYRQGWHLIVWEHRRAVAIIGTPALGALLVAGWYLGSPLFTSETVIEEFPFSFKAEVPEEMTRGSVEETMASLAKLSTRVGEPMAVSMTTAAVIKTGKFENADDFHKGSGTASIYRSPDGSHLLRLENLNVTNGPDLHVILTPHASPDRRSEVKSDGYVDLGKLKGNKGDQNYPVPGDVDVAAQRSVVIYCEPFAVVFSVAMLQDRDFPLAAKAEVPPDMTRAGVERIMATMAKFDQDTSEAMSGAMPMDDTMAKAGTALMEGGISMVKQGMKASDDIMTDKGMAMVQQGAEISGEVLTVDDGMAMAKEGVKTSDDAMVDKGMAMIQEALDKPAETAQKPSAVKLKVGNFRDADGFHKGSGQATIYRGPDGSRLLRLENLNVTNGPDLHVFLTPHQDPGNRGEVHTDGYVDLGKLKGNKGDQNYPIPDELDIDIQGSVVIYCKPFHVVFSVAALGAV